MTSGNLRAVILAGGRGSRLYPFTATLPKPLLPIGERPVIELLVRRLTSFGVGRITVAVNYLADLVESYLGDGRRFNVQIDYLRETMPLGTAGPLGLADPWTSPLIVTNGDILSDIDIGAMLSMHEEFGSSLTIASLVEKTRIESGVLITDSSPHVKNIVEKPTVEHRISLGTYILAPKLVATIEPNVRLEMPDLALSLIQRGETVVAYDHKGMWLDIGRPDDFAKAQNEADTWLGRICGPAGPTSPKNDERV